MAQQLLLEGPDIDRLLVRVRSEHGPDARIVRAERRLVGGFAGFFAKLRYEVAVALDEDAAPPTNAAPVAPMPTPAAAAPSAPTSLEDLLACADAQDGGTHPAADLPADRAPGRALSTESESFDSLMRELVARAAPETRTSAPVDFAPAVPRVITPVPVPVPVPAPAPAPVPVLAAAVPERQPASAPPAEFTAPSRRTWLVTPAVAQLGLPVQAPDVDTDRLCLLELLDDVAVTAPRRLVGIQVLVGDGERATEVVRAWAKACDADPACILELGDAPRPWDGQQSTQHVVQDLALEHGGVLVVVPTGDDLTHAAAAGRTVGEVGGCTVTAVVDACWDVAATAGWLAALADQSQPVGRLAAYAIHDTPDPLGLLEHAVPVTWLDARPATVGAWASPCLDRWR